MAEQTSDVDVQALTILLARVAQTTLGVVVTLMADQVNEKVPTISLRELADQFDWVSNLIRRQVPAARSDGAE